MKRELKAYYLAKVVNRAQRYRTIPYEEGTESGTSPGEKPESGPRYRTIPYEEGTERHGNVLGIV